MRLPAHVTRLLPATILAVVIVATVACLQTATPADGHPWGTYHLCLVRVSDSCHAPGAGCTTLPADNFRSLALSTREDGTLVVPRAPLAPAFGQQRGTRFQFSADAVPVDSVCGCAAQVQEQLHAQFLPETVNTVCQDLDGGSASCRDLPDDGGSTDDWFAGLDAGFDLDAQFPTFKGRLVDSVQIAPGERMADGGTCACQTCRVEYDLTGSL